MPNIQVPPDSTGKLVDATSLDDAGVAVYRQRMILTGASGTAEVVAVSMSAPAASAVGLVVRQAGAISVNGAVGISGTATVAGSVVISGTATVAGSVVISGTATVAGNVNISATAIVAGVVALTAGTANIGHLNHVSRTVDAAVYLKQLYVATNPTSASRGPRMVPLSASAATTIVAAPGAGLAIYVTGLHVSNPTNINSAVRLGTSGTPGNVTMMLALSGGGFVTEYHPPWKLSTNEALIASMKPSTSTVYANVHFFVASADAL